MKLFKSLLVAPATLGLLAPMTATANELNLKDVSGYSSSEEVQNISEFNPAEELAVTNSRVDGLEARFNDFEAGGFSETTTASFSLDTVVGAVDGGNDSTEALSFDYQMNIGLSTSFTGEDSLDVTIDVGNSATTASRTHSAAIMGFQATADARLLTELHTHSHLVVQQFLLVIQQISAAHLLVLVRIVHSLIIWVTVVQETLLV